MPESNPLFERLSYCGLDCGTCYLKNGRIADLATTLLSELTEIRFERWGPSLAKLNPLEVASFRHAESCMAVLKAWDCMRCDKFCKHGGGSSKCDIRDCCRNKGLAGCFECERFETCDTLSALKPVNGELNLVNIRKIIADGIDAFVEETSKSRDLKFYLEPK